MTFFGQAFVVFVNASNPVVAGRGLTGPNGIADIDPLRFFGFEVTTRTQQYYVLLAAVLSSSRGSTSSASPGPGVPCARCARTRSRRGDRVPVNRLKLLAFAIGGDRRLHGLHLRRS